MESKIINNGSLLIFDECSWEFNIDKDGELQFFANMHDPRFNLNLNCKKVYKDLSEGFTRGIFQLTTQLGHTYAKKMRPTELEHLTALGSLLRPGSLNTKFDDGISATIHYINRKNQIEEVPSFHPVTDKILKDTYSV